jgi:hypothetical protein
MEINVFQFFLSETFDWNDQVVFKGPSWEATAMAWWRYPSTEPEGVSQRSFLFLSYL